MKFCCEIRCCFFFFLSVFLFSSFFFFPSFFLFLCFLDWTLCKLWSNSIMIGLPVFDLYKHSGGGRVKSNWLYCCFVQLLSATMLSSVTPQHQQPAKCHLLSTRLWNAFVQTIWMAFLSAVGHKLNFFIHTLLILRTSYILWLLLALWCWFGGEWR